MLKKMLIVLIVTVISQKLAAQMTLPNATKKLPLDSLRNLPLRVVASNYYSNNLSFFCKQELQIQKITKVPVKFRIGSVEEVDKLEGKHSGKP
ncbi:hypothetical protein ACFOW1_04380 [Parasediminibacterium paludis]|uniref:Uncharacterized protein n=1 Tax=Parasediminibacterium paludis TaxID=908966 RepID=A0ABV8PVC0_9BACT